MDRDGVGTGSITAPRAKTPTQITADIRHRLPPLLDAAAVEIAQRRARHAAKVANVAHAVPKLATVPVSPPRR